MLWMTMTMTMAMANPPAVPTPSTPSTTRPTRAGGNIPVDTTRGPMPGVRRMRRPIGDRQAKAEVAPYPGLSDWLHGRNVTVLVQHGVPGAYMASFATELEATFKAFENRFGSPGARLVVRVTREGEDIRRFTGDGAGIGVAVPVEFLSPEQVRGAGPVIAALHWLGSAGTAGGGDAATAMALAEHVSDARLPLVVADTFRAEVRSARRHVRRCDAGWVGVMDGNCLSRNDWRQ